MSLDPLVLMFGHEILLIRSFADRYSARDVLEALLFGLGIFELSWQHNGKDDDSQSNRHDVHNLDDQIPQSRSKWTNNVESLSSTGRKNPDVGSSVKTKPLLASPRSLVQMSHNS